jgi:hypothetical protein
MTSKKSLATSLISLSAGLLLALSAAGGATASPSKSQDSGQPQLATTVASATTTVSSATTTVSSATTAGYWTPERMRAAIPGDVLADRAVARQNSKGTNSGPSVEERGSSTKIAGTSGNGSKTTALHKDELPVRHIGKVFFTLGGANFVCSGNSVVSTNKSTVSTAGHCVNEGPGAFATNFVFVPQYKDGAAPLGKWPAKALFAPKQWSGDGNMQYDTGFAVVSQLNGQNLADVAGASGVAFNQARGLNYKSYGYPAAAPFTGQTLVSCTGKSGNDVINPQFDTQGIPCDMTGGSSGGPWFMGSDATAFQNSINSYGYGTRSTTMFGPYWGDTIQQAYKSASATK